MRPNGISELSTFILAAALCVAVAAWALWRSWKRLPPPDPDEEQAARAAEQHAQYERDMVASNEHAMDAWRYAMHEADGKQWVGVDWSLTGEETPEYTEVAQEVTPEMWNKMANIKRDSRGRFTRGE